jgi:hypothetical protein
MCYRTRREVCEVEWGMCYRARYPMPLHLISAAGGLLEQPVFVASRLLSKEYGQCSSRCIPRHAPSINQLIHLPVQIPIYIRFYLSTSLSLSPSLSLYIYTPIYLSIYLSISLPISLSTHSPAQPSVRTICLKQSEMPLYSTPWPTPRDKRVRTVSARRRCGAVGREA